MQGFQNYMTLKSIPVKYSYSTVMLLTDSAYKAEKLYSHHSIMVVKIFLFFRYTIFFFSFCTTTEPSHN